MDWFLRALFSGFVVLFVALSFISMMAEPFMPMSIYAILFALYAIISFLVYREFR